MTRRPSTAPTAGCSPPKGRRSTRPSGRPSIADVHLGYEWARAAGGDCLPAHSLAETLAKLATPARPGPDRPAGRRGRPRRVARPLPADGPDVRSLVRLARRRGVELVPVLGNHDPPTAPAPPSTLEVAGWTIAHGHRPIAGDRTISGPPPPGPPGRRADRPLLPGRPDVDRPARLHPQRRRPARRLGRDARRGGWRTRSGASPGSGASCSTSAPCPAWSRRSGAAEPRIGRTISPCPW